VAVKASGKPEVDDAIRTALVAEGFSVATSVKSDEGELLYKQEEMVDGGEYSVVRLSDSFAVVLKGCVGLDMDASFTELMQVGNVFSSFNTAQSTLYNKLTDCLYEYKADKGTVVASVKSLLDEFSAYVVGLVQAMPSAAFKADRSIREIVSKAEGISSGTIIGPVTVTIEEAGTVNKEELIEKKDGEKCAKCGEVDCKGGDSCKAKKEDPNPEPAPEPTPEPAAAVAKSETTLTDVLVLLQSVAQKQDAQETRLTEIATTVASVAQESANTKNVVDTLAQKSETLESRMNSVVVAPPAPGDAPSGTTQVTKVDSDPRRGCFDTAMLRLKRDR
jgi:hypothetical protein